MGCRTFQLSDISLRKLLLTTSHCHWMAISLLYVKRSSGTVSMSDSSLCMFTSQRTHTLGFGIGLREGIDSLSVVLSSVNVFPLGSDKTYDQCGNCNVIATVLSLRSSEDTDSVKVLLVPEGRYKPSEETFTLHGHQFNNC